MFGLSIKAATTVATAAFAASAVAQMEAPTASKSADEPVGWTIDLGAGALSVPRFPGADTRRTRAIPAIEARYGDVFFFTFADGLGLDVVRRADWHAGPVVNFAFARKEKDDRAALEGLGDVPFTVEAGGYVRYEFDRYATAKLELRRGVGGHDGVVAEVSLEGHAPPLLDRLFPSLGPRLTGYDRRYARAYYGVDVDQSRRSRYSPFAPGSGLKAGIGGSAVYLVSDRVTLTAFGDYGRLAGEISRSPLVLGHRGSRNQFTAGIALSYRITR